MSDKSVLEHINAIAPEHDRTSCDDENLYNAAYGPDDRGGYGRCRRCGLLDIVRRALASAPAQPAVQAQGEVQRLREALEYAEKNERHSNNSETRYWCKQYKQLARKALANSTGQEV